MHLKSNELHARLKQTKTQEGPYRLYYKLTVYNNSNNLLLKHDCSSAYFTLQLKTTFQCYFGYHLQQAGRSERLSFQLSVCRPWTYKGYPKRAAATSPMNLTRTQSVQAVQSLWLSKPNLAESSVKPSQYMNACPYRPNRSGR